MSASFSTKIRVPAPAEFVCAYLLDIDNWPGLNHSTFGRPSVAWDGPPWRPASKVLIRTGALGMKLTGRYEVLPRTPAELFHVRLNYMGTNAEIHVSVAEAVDGSDVTTDASFSGFAGLFGRGAASSAPKGILFASDLLATRIELAWRRSQLSRTSSN